MFELDECGGWQKWDEPSSANESNKDTSLLLQLCRLGGHFKQAENDIDLLAQL
jgi:hypothetical protein